jgi:hypothetical protein
VLAVNHRSRRRAPGGTALPSALTATLVLTLGLPGLAGCVRTENLGRRGDNAGYPCICSGEQCSCLPLGDTPPPDASSDAAPDAGSDATPDGDPDAAPDGAPDAARDGSPDSGRDAAPDASPPCLPPGVLVCTNVSLGHCWCTYPPPDAGVPDGSTDACGASCCPSNPDSDVDTGDVSGGTSYILRSRSGNPWQFRCLNQTSCPTIHVRCANFGEGDNNRFNPSTCTITVDNSTCAEIGFPRDTTTDRTPGSLMDLINNPPAFNPADVTLVRTFCSFIHEVAHACDPHLGSFCTYKGCDEAVAERVQAFCADQFIARDCPTSPSTSEIDPRAIYCRSACSDQARNRSRALLDRCICKTGGTFGLSDQQCCNCIQACINDNPNGDFSHGTGVPELPPLGGACAPDDLQDRTQRCKDYSMATDGGHGCVGNGGNANLPCMR